MKDSLNKIFFGGDKHALFAPDRETESTITCLAPCLKNDAWASKRNSQRVHRYMRAIGSPFFR